jgi:hypothetical protein
MGVKADPVKRKFEDAILDAGWLTLIFNLDMGKEEPVLNNETMLKRATLAFNVYGGTKRKKTGTISSNEAVGAIADVLSIVINRTMFNNTTKTYMHLKDSCSGGFCTDSVKYKFKDWDTKAKG